MANNEGSNDAADIAAMLRRWIEAFRVVDSETMMTFWPRDYPDIVYQSEENARALGTYEEIKTYWYEQVPPTLDGIAKVEDIDIRIHVHGDLATAYLSALASAKFPGSEHLYVAPFRASIVLRRSEDGWKYVHYTSRASWTSAGLPRRSMPVTRTNSPTAPRAAELGAWAVSRRLRPPAPRSPARAHRPAGAPRCWCSACA
ncbi:hypothetical protein GCM10023321_81670 [Pseudonocardia eucalypti]|uniref:SnoaL-like domain-containing protein n=1 Tax=Pseudonocardia eucalypti TaxID=648755 RepID=A0ABP9RE43_9PSEU|nr:ketosteroid isomerase-like protein [Pseudonocardia eucalypti]